jgi:hypothetical protein
MNTNTNDVGEVDNDEQNGMTRRSLMRKIGAGTATVAVASAGGEYVAPKYSPVGRASAIAPVIVAAAAGGALLGAGGAYLVFGSGEQVDPEDVRGAEADNIHQNAYSSAASLYSADEGFTNELINNIAPESPDKGVFASQLTGYLRRRTYEGLVTGNTASTVKTAVQEDIDEHIAERKRNFIKQWNEYALEIARNLWIVLVESHSNDDLNPSRVFTGEYGSWGKLENYILGNVDTSQDGWRDEIKQPSDIFGTYEITLDNGESIDSHAIPWLIYGYSSDFEAYATPFAGHGNITDNPVGLDRVAWNDTAFTGGASASAVVDPFGGDKQPWLHAARWENIFGTMDNYPDQIRQEVSAYVDNAYNLYAAGELDPVDLMESDDWVKQYSNGDASDATTSAVVAEYISMGYMPPDTGVTVEVDAPGTDLSEGILLLNWDFESVAPWEVDTSNYPQVEYKNQLVGEATLTFEVTNDSMSGTESVTVSASDVDGIEDVDPGNDSVTFDLTQISDAAPSSGYVDSISRSPEGAVTTWIDEGQVVSASQYVTAVLVEEIEEEGVTPRRAHLKDGFELVNVEGADRYEATRYFSRSRDVTRTGEDVDREVDGYTRADEIIVEVSVGDILGGALPDGLGDNALLAVGGGLAALLLAAAGFSGGDR